MYSFWLMPNESASKAYQDIIYSLSRKFNTQVFEPHITLLSGINAPIPDQTFYEISVLAALTPQFKVSFSKMAYQNEFYKCLYLEANPIDKLQQIYKEAKSLFPSSKYKFKPHLSLMYANKSAKSKQRIIKTLGDDIQKKAIFNSIRLMETKGTVDKWKLIEEFPLWNTEDQNSAFDETLLRYQK